MTTTIMLAGASGDLGQRIAKALLARGMTVRALTRHDVGQAERERLSGQGVEIVLADVGDVDAVARACDGAACVVSALNGLRDVIIDRQGVLLDAAAKAGVPRFISSDYAADFTKTEPGRNRNFDLRRDFKARADKAPIKVTSILNGGFMDMLGVEMPIIQPRIRRVIYWGDADQKLDFTMKDDVAAFVAEAARDETTPRILRIAGDTLSARDLAAVMQRVTGGPFRIFKAGNMASLGALIRVARFMAPQPRAVFPPWQGLQYLRDMFSGQAKLFPLDNDRYPDIIWTTVEQSLSASMGRHQANSANAP